MATTTATLTTKTTLTTTTIVIDSKEHCTFILVPRDLDHIHSLIIVDWKCHIIMFIARLLSMTLGV